MKELTIWAKLEQDKTVNGCMGCNYINEYTKLFQVLNMLILAKRDIDFYIKLKTKFCSISLGSCHWARTCLGITVYNQAAEVNKNIGGKAPSGKITIEPHNLVKMELYCIHIRMRGGIYSQIYPYV